VSCDWFGGTATKSLGGRATWGLYGSTGAGTLGRGTPIRIQTGRRSNCGCSGLYVSDFRRTWIQFHYFLCFESTFIEGRRIPVPRGVIGVKSSQCLNTRNYCNEYYINIWQCCILHWHTFYKIIFQFTLRITVNLHTCNHEFFKHVFEIWYHLCACLYSEDPNKRICTIIFLGESFHSILAYSGL